MQIRTVWHCGSFVTIKKKLHDSAGTSLPSKTEVEAANKGVSSAL